MSLAADLSTSRVRATWEARAEETVRQKVRVSATPQLKPSVGPTAERGSGTRTQPMARFSCPRNREREAVATVRHYQAETAVASCRSRPARSSWTVRSLPTVRGTRAGTEAPADL